MNEFPDGWWLIATRRPSPHQDARPADAIIDMLVIHAISLPPQEFGGGFVDALFMGTLDPAAHPALGTLAGVRVSAHFLIDRGGNVVQFVPLSARAWHAGVSSFGGVPACNDRALGIELEGADTCPFTAAQYDRLAALCAALFGALPALRLSRVIGHADIAPGRKTDPGPCFDWVRFRAALAARLRGAQAPR
ncbi:MAG: 1,6-anhydro-N-acetylmuramyl-L-alanine amidase AmpD [Gammaproteobacteria bacterium]